MRAFETRHRLAFSMGAVLLAHVFLLLGLPQEKPTRIVKSSSSSSRVPLHISLKTPPLSLPPQAAQSKPKISNANPAKESPSTKMAAESASPPPEGATRAALPRAESRSYARLLPAAGEVPVVDRAPGPPQEGSLLRQQQFAADIDGKARQELMRDGANLNDLFDVPLKTRRLGVAREASVLLTFDQGRIKLQRLRGEPLLRAVLFESLLDEKTQTIMRRIFAQLRTRQLRISIETLDEPSGDDETYFWSGNRLSIVKNFLPALAAGSGTITLPDEEAKRAELRDATHLTRLQRSAAYRSPLNSRTL